VKERDEKIKATRIFYTDDIDKVPCENCISLPICISHLVPSNDELEYVNIAMYSRTCSMLKDFLTYDLVYDDQQCMSMTLESPGQIDKVMKYISSIINRPIKMKMFEGIISGHCYD
jgi:hypothetical protein